MGDLLGSPCVASLFFVFVSARFSREPSELGSYAEIGLSWTNFFLQFWFCRLPGIARDTTPFVSSRPFRKVLIRWNRSYVRHFMPIWSLEKKERRSGYLANFLAISNFEIFFAILILSASGHSPGHHAVHLFASFSNWGHTLKSEFPTKRYVRLEFQKQCIDVLLQKTSMTLRCFCIIKKSDFPCQKQCICLKCEFTFARFVEFFRI